jgi:hypothetical protein
MSLHPKGSKRLYEVRLCANGVDICERSIARCRAMPEIRAGMAKPGRP